MHVPESFVLLSGFRLNVLELEVLSATMSKQKNVCMHLAASQPLLVNPGFCAVHESYLL